MGTNIAIKTPVIITNKDKALPAGSIVSSEIPAGTFLEKWNSAAAAINKPPTAVYKIMTLSKLSCLICSSVMAAADPNKASATTIGPMDVPNELIPPARFTRLAPVLSSPSAIANGCAAVCCNEKPSATVNNPDNIIKADKTILVDNSPEEQLFFYISQYAFAWLESQSDIEQQTTNWANEHNIENWKEVWDGKYAKNFEQAFVDGKLKYMWQLNFAHHDLMDQLTKGKEDIKLVDADDHARLFNKQEEDFTDTLFAYANSEADHLVVGDDWFDHYESTVDYLEIERSFRLKKFIIDYTKLYKRKKQLYQSTFAKYL